MQLPEKYKEKFDVSSEGSSGFNFRAFALDLPDKLKKTTPCLYADDTQIFCSSNDYERIGKLNSDLQQISDWLARNRLQKIKYMIIGSSYNLTNKVHDYPVFLNNKPLCRTSSFECLGVY